ncbi:MAG: hypothetical protein ABI824_09830 [Acidobacteriota bacterium]
MALRSFKPRGSLDRSATADLFRNTLSRIPSLYGRLVYLSSLRDPNSGVYRHYGMTSTFGRENGTLAIETNHNRAFREWLKLALREKRDDIATYVDGLDDPKHLVVKYWLESQGYLGCIPDGASRAERLLFSKDVEVLLRTVSPPQTKAINHGSGGGLRGLGSRLRT